jgi:hypothetical protein
MGQAEDAHVDDEIAPTVHDEQLDEPVATE